MINRKEIKEAAKEKVKGNKWNLIWPLLAIYLIFEVINTIIAKIGGIDIGELLNQALISIQNGEEATIDYPTWYSLISLIVSMTESILIIGYTKYVLDLIRTGNAKFKDIFKFFKENWKRTLLLILIMGIAITLGTILFIIPGIIITLGLSMARYLLVDTEDKAMDLIKNSWAMMKGHKWEFFVFGLSFIGWALLVPFTLGLLLIWLYPYMTIATAMYYEKLKEITQK